MQSSRIDNETRPTLKLMASLGLAAVTLLSSGVTGAIAQDFSTPTPAAQTPASFSAPITGYFLFVNPTVGNDAGEGSQRFPLRTITRALQLAQPNTVIVLNAGTYSAETGETFPLVLKPGVTLQGEMASRGRGIVIRGGGEFISPTFARQNITLLGANQALLSGVTLTNPNPRGYALWIESSSPTVVSNTFSNSTHDGISITGHGAPLIQGNVFVQNGANGITIFGTAQPQIQENVFERTGFGVNIAQQAAPVLMGNRIINNEDGIVVQGNARPTLRGNTIEGNERDGLVAIARSLPNLGTANDPGQNTFRNNGRYDVNTSAATQAIAAWGNELVSNRVHGSLNLGGQSVATGSPSTPSAALGAARSTTLPSTPITTPASPTNASGSFAALPALQPAAPIAAPVQPVTQGLTQPTRPERLPLLAQSRLTPAMQPPNSTTSAFPSPSAMPSSSASTPGAIEIPVPPPGDRADRPALAPRSSAPTPAPVAIAPATAATPPIREVTVQRSSQSSLPSAQAMSVQIAAPATAIEIPVPPPSNRPAPSPLPQQAAPRGLRPTAPVPNSNVLPVPNGNAPLGNIGDMPTVVVSRNPLQRRADVPPPAPNRAAVLGLRYRVVVEAEDENTQAIVRSLIPGAFRTQANGRIMMQAGAYSDRTNADETVQWLSSNGLRAIVQPVD